MPPAVALRTARALTRQNAFANADSPGRALFPVSTASQLLNIHALAFAILSAVSLPTVAAQPVSLRTSAIPVPTPKVTATPKPATPADPATLDRVQVTATRVARDLQRTPAAVSIVSGARIHGDTPGATLSEKLAGVPGVLSRPRQNYAQDEQLSIRGFGTRASFGVRSVRVIVDGIPATLPDGQGQLSQIPLAAIDRIEVLRGPFAALYGNGAGGVVQVFTVDGRAPGDWRTDATAGSFGERRFGAQARGATGAVAYTFDANHFETDGWRRHSHAERTTADAKLRREFASGQLTLMANVFDAPGTLDPQGLTAAQVAQDPRQASPGALRFNTRKSARQSQLAAVYERPLGTHDAVRVLAWRGNRRIEQVLSTPPEAQRNPLSAGGWINLHAPFSGAETRWTAHRQLAARPLEFVATLGVEDQEQLRRGYENFVGSALGVRGRLRQQQRDHVQSLDETLQGTWDVSDRWSLAAGVRASTVRFVSRDQYIAPGNPDDSGRARYHALSPVVGVTYRATHAFAVHAAVGRGFETPTFNELGYRSDGGSGLNFALQPTRTRSGELGVRYDTGARQAELTAFQADSGDELIVNTSAGGRTTFRNAGRARRRGVEGALQWAFADAWHLDLATTWLDASFRDSFAACTGSSCRAPVARVAAGTALPGVPRLAAHAALRRGAMLGWHAQVDVDHVASVTATTAGDVRAPGYTVAGASMGYGFDLATLRGRAFVGVSNLFDRRTIGSVIVNESSQRYFEPGAGRALTLGVELDWKQ